MSSWALLKHNNSSYVTKVNLLLMIVQIAVQQIPAASFGLSVAL